MTTEKPVPEPENLSRRLDEARLRQRAIGIGLRTLFDEVVNEDVPDEFLDILRTADDRSTGKG